MREYAVYRTAAVPVPQGRCAEGSKLLCPLAKRLSTWSRTWTPTPTRTRLIGHHFMNHLWALQLRNWLVPCTWAPFKWGSAWSDLSLLRDPHPNLVHTHTHIERKTAARLSSFVFIFSFQLLLSLLFRFCKFLTPEQP